MSKLEDQLDEILGNLLSLGEMYSLDDLTEAKQRLIDIVTKAKITQLELLKGEYFGVIGVIAGNNNPLQPLTSNVLVNRIDQIIAELQAKLNKE